MTGYIGLSPTLRQLKDEIDGFVQTQTTTRIISANGSIVANDSFIFASGNTTLTLPSAAGLSGTKFYIKNTGNNIIIISTVNSETIDNNISISLTEKNSTIGVISDNTAWSIF